MLVSSSDDLSLAFGPVYQRHTLRGSHSGAPRGRKTDNHLNNSINKSRFEGDEDRHEIPMPNMLYVVETHFDVILDHKSLSISFFMHATLSLSLLNRHSLTPLLVRDLPVHHFNDPLTCLRIVYRLNLQYVWPDSDISIGLYMSRAPEITQTTTHFKVLGLSFL